MLHIVPGISVVAVPTADAEAEAASTTVTLMIGVSVKKHRVRPLLYESWAEEADKDPLELFAKDAVDDDVHAGVARHQEVGHVVQGDDVDRENLEDVHHQGQDVADKEHDHDDHEHGRQSNFLLL